MSENSRPSVAIRIVRPYETEEELLEHELETVGKTSVVLIGAHPRPTGVILRFEVTLSSGATVLRGEGRVLAHKENAFRGQSGLTLRFTRLDPKSKGVVDRATSMREARAQETGSPSRPSVQVPVQASPIADALTASTPSPAPVAEPPDPQTAVAAALAAARAQANATARANAKRTGPPGGLTPPPNPAAHARQRIESRPTPAPTPVTSVPGEVEAKTARYEALAMTTPPPQAPQAQTIAPGVTAPTLATPPLAMSRRAPRAKSLSPVTSAGTVEAPADRAELLERLRECAANLPRERVEEILSARASR